MNTGESLIPVLDRDRRRLLRGRPPRRRGELQPEARGPGLMRHPARTAAALAVAAAAEEPLAATAADLTPPAAAVIATTRLGFGPRPGDVAAFDALAADDPARLAAWLDTQLAPATIDDAACDARLAASGFTTLAKPLTQLWADHHLADPEWGERIRPFREVRLATFLRAVHSRRQLFELLCDFWHNHFNVYADDFLTAVVWAHSDRIVRQHALGNFRSLLGAIAQSPAMLFYLTNFESSADAPNENYPRELLELHGLGAENYFGATPPGAVPRDAQNRPLGYCDADVTAVAQCLTGWTVRSRSWDPDFGDTGEFFVHEPWHHSGAKTVLGVGMPAGRGGLADGNHALDLIAAHPGTARFVARKLCRRLVADLPAQELVDAAAATFAAHVASPDQIARVVRTIASHPLFLQTWGEKLKRPFEHAVSSLRAMSGDLPFAIDEEVTDWFLWMYGQTGQPLFEWHAPNGYPDFRNAWKSTAPRVMSWRVANMLVQADDAGGNLVIDLLGQIPPEVRSARALVLFWTERMLGRRLPQAEEDELIDFMAQGRNPELDLPVAGDEETRDRIRTLVALICMCPEFQLK